MTPLSGTPSTVIMRIMEEGVISNEDKEEEEET